MKIFEIIPQLSSGGAERLFTHLMFFKNHLC